MYRSIGLVVMHIYGTQLNLNVSTSNSFLVSLERSSGRVYDEKGGVVAAF